MRTAHEPFSAHSEFRRPIAAASDTESIRKSVYSSDTSGVGDTDTVSQSVRQPNADEFCDACANADEYFYACAYTGRFARTLHAFRGCLYRSEEVSTRL